MTTQQIIESVIAIIDGEQKQLEPDDLAISLLERIKNKIRIQLSKEDPI
jgi:GTP-binding protein EngB required for normal cell division